MPLSHRLLIEGQIVIDSVLFQNFFKSYNVRTNRVVEHNNGFGTMVVVSKQSRTMVIGCIMMHWAMPDSWSKMKCLHTFWYKG